MPKQTPKTPVSSVKTRPKAAAKPATVPRPAPKRAVKRPAKPARPVKKRRLLWLDITVGIVTVVLVGFAIWYNARSDQQPACTASAEHEVRVAGDVFTPSEINVKRCDVLKVINAGREDYDLMFGQRDEHVNYPGFQMTLIRPNEFFVVDMVQSGAFEMHDHIRDKARLQLEVKD